MQTKSTSLIVRKVINSGVNHNNFLIVTLSVFFFFFSTQFSSSDGILIGDNNSANDDTSALLKNLSTSASFHHTSSLTQQLKSASIAASLNAIAAAAAANTQATKLKGKRKSLTGMSANSNAIDMLNERLNASDSKRFCEQTSNSKSIAPNKSSEKRKYPSNNILSLSLSLSHQSINEIDWNWTSSKW